MSYVVLSMTRYMIPLDVETLFREGATSFRADLSLVRRIHESATEGEWFFPELPDGVEIPDFCPRHPMCRLSNRSKENLRSEIDEVLSDSVLMSSFKNFGSFSCNEVEVFNGSLDSTWHHDGLAGKRGHAGDFFLLVYFDLKGQGGWDSDWGGAFEYGARNLSGDWVHEICEPDTRFSVFPSPRTAVLGWNGNPRFIHRSAPLLRRVDRFVLAASVRHESGAAR